MSGIFEMTFYAQDPKGQVHAVKTRTSTDIGSMESFKKMWAATGYRTKYDHEVEENAEINRRILANQGKPAESTPDLAFTFNGFDGTVVEHASVKAFFQAIGYDAEAKRKVRNAYKRWKTAAFLKSGGVMAIDTKPFRVAFSA